MPKFEAGFLERGYCRIYLDPIIIADRFQEFGIQIDYRETSEPETVAQFGFVAARRLLKQDNATPIEIFDESGMEHNSRRVAVPPFHGDIASACLELAPNELRHFV
jgi:hypothetical protein